MPIDFRPRTLCRNCGEPISFTLNHNDKWVPTNDDGSNHFSTCVAKKQERGPRPPDDVCLACGSLDVERLPGQGPHWGAIRCNDCRQHRWLRAPQ